MRSQYPTGLDALASFFNSIRHRPGRSRALERLGDLESGLAVATMPKGTDTHGLRLNRAMNSFIATMRLNGLDDTEIGVAAAGFLGSSGLRPTGPRCVAGVLYVQEAVKLIRKEQGLLALLCDISIESIDELWLTFSGQVPDDDRPQWTDAAPIIASM